MKKKTYRRLSRIKKLAIVSTMGTAMAFPFGGCNLGEFTSTTTVTLSGREVVTYLVQSAILTPIQNWVNNAVDNFFDQLEEDDA